jgi:hypothetical protein
MLYLIDDRTSYENSPFRNEKTGLAKPFSGRRFLPFISRIDQRNNVFHAPQTIGNASGHGRRNAQRPILTHKVVIQKTERQRMTMIVDLL